MLRRRPSLATPCPSDALCNYFVDFLSLTPSHGHTTCWPWPRRWLWLWSTPGGGTVHTLWWISLISFSLMLLFYLLPCFFFLFLRSSRYIENERKTFIKRLMLITFSTEKVTIFKKLFNGHHWINSMDWLPILIGHNLPLNYCELPIIFFLN